MTVKKKIAHIVVGATVATSSIPWAVLNDPVSVFADEMNEVPLSNETENNEAQPAPSSGEEDADNQELQDGENENEEPTVEDGNEEKPAEESKDPIVKIDFEWKDNGNNTAAITDYIGEGENVVIPSNIEGLAVTHISAGAFKNKSLSSITLPEGIKIIGGSAFQGNKLKSVLIPISVTSIGRNAFADNQANPSDFVLSGYEDSVAKEYAAANNFTFTSLDKSNELPTPDSDEAEEMPMEDDKESESTEEIAEPVEIENPEKKPVTDTRTPEEKYNQGQPVVIEELFSGSVQAKAVADLFKRTTKDALSHNEVETYFINIFGPNVKIKEGLAVFGGTNQSQIKSTRSISPMSAYGTTRTLTVGQSSYIEYFTQPDNLYAIYNNANYSWSYIYENWINNATAKVSVEGLEMILHNGGYGQKFGGTFTGIAEGTTKIRGQVWRTTNYSSPVLEFDILTINVLPAPDTQPPTITLTPNTTAPTNKNVTVTANITDDKSTVSVKKWAAGNRNTAYFASNGANLSTSFVVSDNGVYTVYAKDDKGNETVKTININNIDKTAPSISISDVIEGNVYVNSVTPRVTATDTNNVTTTLFLNGKEFNGTSITESGTHTFTVRAVDQAGNEATKTITFTVNHTPAITGHIEPIFLKKFAEKTIDLSTVFTDREGDELTFSVSSSNESSVTVNENDGKLSVQAIKQGSATVSVTANDGHSNSQTVTFEVNVESVAPIVSISNDQTWIISNEESFILEGTVKDEDKEEVSITATVAGIEKTDTVLTTGDNDNWSIQFSGNEIATGVYTLVVQAKDPFGLTDDTASSKFIVKVPVPMSEYEPVLAAYEGDISKTRQDFTNSEHTVLLEAFTAVESLKETNNPDAWLFVKPKVDLLADGTVKTGFYQTISGNAFDYLTDNLDSATKSDYETAGMTDVKDSLVPTYNEKNADYLAEKGELTEEDIQLIIDVVNAVDKATSSNSVEDWKKAKEEIEKLADGPLKEEYLQIVEDGFVKAIEVNPSELTAELIGQELDIPAHTEREADYQQYLTDILVIDPVLTKERLQEVIDSVDGIYDAQHSFQNQPSQENLSSFESKLEELTDGGYKTQNEVLLPSMNLEMVVNDPSTMTEAALTTIAVTHDETHIPLYQDFLTDYLVDVAKEDITKEILQQTINVVDAKEVVKENPTDENIQDLLDLIGGLNPDASVIDDLLDEVGGAILDNINDDFTKVTEKQLENIGIEDINSSRLPTYQDALNDYANEQEPNDLTREDIQQVIDAINGVEDAKGNPSEESIQAGYDAVNQLEDGELKVELLQELENIAVDYIANNPNELTQNLLDLANLVTDSDLFDSYKEYLQDVLPSLSEEVTKEKLQELINAVNAVWEAYHEALANPSKPNVVAFENLATGLMDGTFKTAMVELIDDVALVYLIASPATQENDDYSRIGVSIIEDNISSYNSNMAKYIVDVGVENFDFTEAQQVITVTDKVEVALADSSVSNVQQALLELQNLQSGTLKNDLANALSGQVIKDINNKPGEVTADDLENIGVEDVNPDYEEQYQDALEDFKEDLGRDLTFEDIQDVIDAVNQVEKAIETGDPQDIIDAYEEIIQLPDGSLKDKLLGKIKEEAIKEIIENPSDVTTEILIIGDVKDVDVELEDEYKDALSEYVQPLTDESIQQLVDLVNQVKKARLNLTQADINSLSEMVDSLAESTTKSKMVSVKEALQSILNAEMDLTTETIQLAKDKSDAVSSLEKEYVKLMSESLTFIHTAISNPTDVTVQAGQEQLAKLENGSFKSRLQSRIRAAYLEHIIKTPGESSYSDWVNAGFDNVNEDSVPSYKDAVEEITNETGPLTKEQIQDIIDAINAIDQAKNKPTNDSIQKAKDAIDKIVDSELKDEWLKEMDELWKSIQPKPSPDPTPEVKPEPIPQPSEKVMVSENEYAAVVMTIPQIEVSQTDSLKVRIKVSAKDVLDGSKLYLYANNATTNRVGSMALASLANNFPSIMSITNNGQQMLEIDFGKLDKGTVEVDRELVFDENGEYLLKGLFLANGTSLETNSVKISVFKELQIPNTTLPNPHGLPVATLKANAEIDLYKLDKNGEFVKSKKAQKGSLLHIYDTHKGYYKLADDLYAAPSSVTVHIGKGEVRKKVVNVYDKDGKFIRTIKKGQQYKVYSYNSKRYAIGGGEYIDVQDGVTYVFGWITVKEPMTLLKPDGTVARTLKPGENYRVYRADHEKLHVGGGYTIKLEKNKFSFLKN